MRTSYVHSKFYSKVFGVYCFCGSLLEGVCVCAAANDSETNKPSSSVPSDVVTTPCQAELYAMLDTGQTKPSKTPLPVSGPELSARLKIGTRVIRGVDWKWGDQVEFFVDAFFALSPLRLFLLTQPVKFQYNRGKPGTS